MGYFEIGLLKITWQLPPLPQLVTASQPSAPNVFSISMISGLGSRLDTYRSINSIRYSHWVIYAALSALYSEDSQRATTSFTCQSRSVTPAASPTLHRTSCVTGIIGGFRTISQNQSTKRRRSQTRPWSTTGEGLPQPSARLRPEGSHGATRCCLWRARYLPPLHSRLAITRPAYAEPISAPSPCVSWPWLRPSML